MNEIDSIVSDGYDVAQTAICFLYQFTGRKASEIYGKDRKKHLKFTAKTAKGKRSPLNFRVCTSMYAIVFARYRNHANNSNTTDNACPLQQFLFLHPSISFYLDAPIDSAIVSYSVFPSMKTAVSNGAYLPIGCFPPLPKRYVPPGKPVISRGTSKLHTTRICSSPNVRV